VVAVETSNCCPHTSRHPRCPRSILTDKLAWLEADIVLSVFDSLGRGGYANTVVLSQYNDPLADPRLVWFMDELRHRAPLAQLHMYTTSWLLTQELVNELAAHGLASLLINRYDAAEEPRTFQAPRGSRLLIEHRNGGHDDRLTLYSRPPRATGQPYCGLPSREIAVHYTGQVGLCCFDWLRGVNFGDLHTAGLEEIITGQRRQDLISSMERSGRTLGICERCTHGLEHQQ
jgi:hypothetical protein